MPSAITERATHRDNEAKPLIKPPTAERFLPRWIVVPLVIALVLPWVFVVLLLALPRNPLAGNSRAGNTLIGSPKTATVIIPTAVTSPVIRTAASHESRAASSQSGWKIGKVGPWGQVETKTFILGPPEDATLGPPGPPVCWFFPGYDKEKVLATLRLAGIPDGQGQVDGNQLQVDE